MDVAAQDKDVTSVEVALQTTPWVAAEDVAFVDAAGGRARTEVGGGVSLSRPPRGSRARRRRRGHGMAAEDVTSADMAAWRGERGGRADGHRRGRGHKSTAVVP